MERNDFGRAWAFLNFTPAAKWVAAACAAGTALLYVALLAVAALFIDLLVSDGRIPSYADLNARHREQAEDVWKNGLRKDSREEAFQRFGVAKDVKERLNSLDTELTADERELRWQVATWATLRDRVGETAAEQYRDAAAPEDGKAARPDADQGALSLVARTQGGWKAPLVGALAAWNPWTWRPLLGGTPSTSYLNGLLAVAAVLALVRAVLMNVMHTAAATAAIEAGTRLRRTVYHHSYRLGTLAVDQQGPTEAIGIFTRHVEAVQDGLHAWLTVAPREPVKLALLVLFALTVHFWLGMTVLVLAAILALAGNQLASTVRRRGRLAGRKAAGVLALLQESLLRMRLVKGYQMELFNQARVERQLADFSEAQHQRYRGETFTRPVVVFLATVAGAFLLYVAGRVHLHGGVGLGSLVVMAAALVSLYEPSEKLVAFRKTARRARESAGDLFEFLDRRGEVATALGADFLPAMQKELVFDDVTLTDPEGRRLLDNVSFSVGAGQRVAVVGPDDAEKHALVYLIPRFLDPTSGEVRVDGQNVRWVTIDSLRTQVGTVLAHNLTFNDTVANNIGCGDPRFTIPQIIEAAKLAHAHQFISKLPHGYETPVGDLGHPLRPGEQFRIALARAILRDPSVLIIEEPAGALDEASAELIDDTFDRILPGRTAIFLAHRLGTIRSCDEVHLLVNGRIEASGQHRELLEGNDLYKHLHYLEFNAFAETV